MEKGRYGGGGIAPALDSRLQLENFKEPSYDKASWAGLRNRRSSVSHARLLKLASHPDHSINLGA